MKKLICFVLSLCLCFCFAACGGDKKHEPEKDVGIIDKLAAEGKITEYAVTLGTSVSDFKKEYPEDYPDADESKVLLSETEGETAVCLTTLNASFYYEKANVDKGISVIAVTGGEAYGFLLGDTVTKSDIVAAVSAELTESSASPERLYFFPGYVENCKVLTAEYETYRLDFFLIEDFLMAVTLTDTNYWTD